MIRKISTICFCLVLLCALFAGAASGICAGAAETQTIEICSCDDAETMDTQFVGTLPSRLNFVEGTAALQNTKDGTDGYTWIRNREDSPLHVDCSEVDIAGSAITFYLYLSSADMLNIGNGLPQFAVDSVFKAEGFDYRWGVEEWVLPQGQTSLAAGWNKVYLPLEGKISALEEINYFQFFADIKANSSILLDAIALTSAPAGAADTLARSSVLLDGCDADTAIGGQLDMGQMMFGSSSVKNTADAAGSAVFETKSAWDCGRINLQQENAALTFYLKIAQEGSFSDFRLTLWDADMHTAEGSFSGSIQGNVWKYLTVACSDMEVETGFDFDAIRNFKLEVRGLSADTAVNLDAVRIVNKNVASAVSDPSLKEDGSLPDATKVKAFRSMETIAGWSGVSHISSTALNGQDVSAFILGDSSYDVFHTAQAASSLNKSVDLTQFDPYYLTLSCWIYVSDPSLVDYVGKEYDNYGLKGAAFELTCRRNWYDGNGFLWNMQNLDIRPGWNKVSLRLKDVAAGTYDYNDINYFRWYIFYDLPQDGGDAPQFAIADIQFIETNQPSMVTAYASDELDVSGKSPYPTYPEAEKPSLDLTIPEFEGFTFTEKTLPILCIAAAALLAAGAIGFVLIRVLKKGKKNGSGNSGS